MEFSRDNLKLHFCLSIVDKFQCFWHEFLHNNVGWRETNRKIVLHYFSLSFTLLNSEYHDRFFLPHHHIFCRQNKVGGLEFQRRLKHLHNQQMLSSQPFFARSSSSVQMLRRIAEIFFLNCLNNGHTQRFLCFLGFFVLEVLPCFWNKIWLQRRTLFSTFL